MLYAGRADMTNPKKKISKYKTKILELERRPLVKFYVMTEGWGPQLIAKAIEKRTNKSCSRQTVGDDLHVLSAENQLWQHNQASIGWMSKFREMYTNALIEEAYLTKKMQDHRLTEELSKVIESELSKEDEQYLSTHEDDIMNPAMFIMYDRALNTKRIEIREMMEQSVLYEKTKEYADYYARHTSTESEHHEIS